MLTGDNGILTQAQNAKKETEIAKIIEEVRLDILGKQTENGGGDISSDELEEILKKYFSNEEQNLKDIIAGTSTDKLISKEDETIKIDLSEIYNRDIKDGTTPPPVAGATDGSWSDEEGVNTPVIKENMELVKWDNTQNKFVPDDTNSSYDYENNEWANAKVTIDGVDSYFVWIPRYEYKINYNTPGTPEDGGTIDINFIPISQTTPTSGYTIHPAFTDDVENGGWNEELPGIWVGKYESSLVNKATSDTAITSGTDIIVDSTKNTDKAIAVKPGMSSWRNCTIGNQYTSAKAYSTNLNSHMLKNSEWGAVAYLTESKYGRNGTEVDMNNESFITAMGDIGNVGQSSTGNETGIYDLRGGAYERVAAYYTGGNATYLNNGSSLVDETDKKMVTAYTGTNVSTDYKLGDATYETKNWHSDYASFVKSNFPFFNRGGSYDGNASHTGVFYYIGNNGSAGSINSFRMCLAVK